MTEFREILDEAFDSVRDRHWGHEDGTFVVIVKVEGDKDWPSRFIWSPDATDSLETLSLWRDPVIGQWVATFEEGSGSLTIVTPADHERPSLS